MHCPILYTFRRCPYAMRARYTLHHSRIYLILREISLRNKPVEMLQQSPKGTVPVLILPQGNVLAESLEIMHWALDQNDPNHWFLQRSKKEQAIIEQLIQYNDHKFKLRLDCYKYGPEAARSTNRHASEAFLQALELRLTSHTYLLGETPSLADVAIFPFIRQFSRVDINWFSQAPYPKLQQWLSCWIDSPAFKHIMQKFALYHPQSPAIFWS